MVKVLFAYVSKRGSSAAIAEAIVAVLREPGLEVDCVEAGAVAERDGCMPSCSAAPCA